MNKIIRKISDFDHLLEAKVTHALKQTQKIVNDCMQESINEYYHEKVFRGGKSATPLIYERTYKLLNSLVKTEIVKTGNTLSCEVKIDESYLSYKYPGTEGWDGIPATGLDVLQWNEADGSHGGTVPGEWNIWGKGMEALGGESGIMSIFISKIRKCGIPIQ